MHIDNVINFTLLQFDNIGKAGNCLDTLGHRDAGDTVGVSTCHNLGGNQLFMISEADEIRKNNLCLDGTQISAVVKLLVCHGHGGNQKWVYNENVSLIILRIKSHGISALFF